MRDNLHNMLLKYIDDPSDANVNYALGREYEKIGHTAGAISYLLRAAERTEDRLFSYECLVRIANCFDKQGNRQNIAKAIYRAAIAWMPERPEAYHFIAKNHENEGSYSESYAYASIGYDMEIKQKDLKDLDVGFNPGWGLLFTKARSGWWLGKNNQSRREIQNLVDDHFKNMDKYHQKLLEEKALEFGVELKLADIMETINDIKTKIIEVFNDYDSKYEWGWATLNKAGYLIDCTEELCTRVDNPICVEIGVFAGKSLLPIALSLQRNKKGIIHGIDPWTNEEATKGYSDLNYEYWNRIDLEEKYNFFKNLIVTFNLEDYVKVIVDTSDNTPEIKNIDLLHIDGQHTGQAIRDAKKFASQVTLNGYCFVDDINWGKVSNVPYFLRDMGFVEIHRVDAGVMYKRVQIKELSETSSLMMNTF